MSTYRFADGPLLQQILVNNEAITPTTMKIRVVTRNPISKCSPKHSINQRFTCETNIIYENQQAHPSIPFKMTSFIS